MTTLIRDGLKQLKKTFLYKPDNCYEIEQINRTNLQRVQYVSLIFVLLHFILIVVFSTYSAGLSPKVQLWRSGLIQAHGTMLVIASISAALAFWLRRKEQFFCKLATFLPNVISLLYLLFCVWVSVVDLLIIPAITPFILATISVGVILLLRPLIATINYSIALGVLGFCITRCNFSSEVLLSIHVNSFASALLGLGVSMLVWQRQTILTRQSYQIAEQKSELEVKNQELELLATRDALTGLMNRAQFVRSMNLIADQAGETESEAAIMMIDIDHFKAVNDQFGHPAGDQVLIEIAQVMVKNLPNNAVLARLGGEEFIVLLPNTTLELGTKIAEKLRQAIEKYPIELCSQKVQVTASFGVTSLQEMNDETLHSHYLKVDKALYLAKHQGRNCVQVL